MYNSTELATQSVCLMQHPNFHESKKTGTKQSGE